MSTTIRDIPLSKLVPSQKNVRRTGIGERLEELAASIAAHGLLQSLSVTPVVGADGAESDKFSVSGGGRRLAALKLLAKRKVIPKIYRVPCLVHEGEAEEASLAENVVREQLHPADQFEAFKRLHDEQGLGAEDIAARFGVSVQVVRQRLRLGALSPVLMQVYRNGELTLDQLMAFAISEDHARQEALYTALGWNREPYLIRRMMTEGHVPPSDKRAKFVGAEAYEGAGGVVIRDLFSNPQDGYFEDAALLERLAVELLTAIAAEVQANEGWAWADGRIDYPHGEYFGRVYPHEEPLSPENQIALDQVTVTLETYQQQYGEAEEIPDDVVEAWTNAEREAKRLQDSAYVFHQEECASSGIIVVLNHDGAVRIERGLIREQHKASENTTEDNLSDEFGSHDAEQGQNAPAGETTEDETEIAPLPDSMFKHLTAHKTLAMRVALGDNPDIALLALTHTLVAATFFHDYDNGACLTIRPDSQTLTGFADDLAGSRWSERLHTRHEAWAVMMPQRADDLWEFIADLDADSRAALLAHCVSITAFAVRFGFARPPRALATAEQIATALSLDMTTYWQPTATSYFSHVTKARIIEAVREGVSEEAAERIASLKKQDMAIAAEQLLMGTGWLPEILRTTLPENATDQPAFDAEQAAFVEAAE